MGASDAWCFTLCAPSINNFFLKGYIIALAISKILHARAIKVLPIMICLYGCVSCTHVQIILLFCSLFSSYMPPYSCYIMLTVALYNSSGNTLALRRRQIFSLSRTSSNLSTVFWYSSSDCWSWSCRKYL